ncbi:MAG: N-acetyltransferase, partial [Blastochloris sp.]|nr:N-acetyltransferase [Blastochloris sp.]
MLQRIYAVALQSFQRNPFFTPISLDAFVAQYLPLRPYLHPG